MFLPAVRWWRLPLVLLVMLSTTGRSFSACTSLLLNNGNVKFTVSSSSLGPGYPVLHGNDVWCAGVIDSEQFLKVDLGFNLFFDQVFVQGMRDSNRSVSLYYLKTSTDNNTFTELHEHGVRKEFFGPSFDGDAVVDTNLTIPVQARWILLNPRETLSGNHLCMRIDIRSCQNEPHPVDGQLTEWSFWSNCTKGSNPCFSIRSRYRTCTKPAPAFDGKDCRDAKYMEQVCDSTCPPSPTTGASTTEPTTTPLPPVDGMWSDWGTWSACTKSCGNGTRHRTRLCNNPSPAQRGVPCKGDTDDTELCFIRHCPIAGKWSVWESWSPCSETCDNGTRTRVRLCNNPSPAHGGMACEGETNNTEVCLVRRCPIDGQWTPWGAWSACSETCGNGTRTRLRLCNNPTPAYGGLACEGNSNNTEVCLVRHCPVDGQWSLWETWSACSETCGSGTRTRVRLCKNPTPAHGGKVCEGAANNSEICLVRHCPVAGKWSAWETWSACSETCGNGTRSRVRLCNNSTPAHDGADCKGDANNTEVCLVHHCPVDGEWSNWGAWSACSETCGTGKSIRVRLCNNPAPAHSGKACVGTSKNTEVCLVRHCPGCGEIGPLKDSSYRAFNATLQAPFARLNTSHPKASVNAWCRDEDDVNGYLQVNLEKPVEVYRVATKGQEKTSAKGWVTKYLISFSNDGSIFTNYMEGGKKKEFSGNTNSFSLSFNHLNTSSQVQYMRFHPISFEGHPCMQVSVFGCMQDFREPVEKIDENKPWGGVLIAFVVLAGTLTVILVLACCYFWCCNMLCNRGKTKSSYLTEGGYLMEPDKRFVNIPPGILKKNVRREPENEVQEVCVEMKEEGASGVIQFEVETKGSNAKLVTAESVHSEPPVYKEDASRATMEGSNFESRTNERPVAERGAECSRDINEPNQRSGYINRGFVSSQEWPMVEQRHPAQIQMTTKEITRSRSDENLATLYHELYGDELGFLNANFKAKDSDNDEQLWSRCRTGTERQDDTPEEETRSSRGQMDGVSMEISNDQLRDEGFQIFSFEDGTVFAEIQYNNNNM